MLRNVGNVIFNEISTNYLAKFFGMNIKTQLFQVFHNKIIEIPWHIGCN